jgi:hypothetical protein
VALAAADALVDGQGLFGGPLPGEIARSRVSGADQAFAQRAIPESRAQRARERLRIGRASPATSGSDERFDATTGTPHTMASSSGSPNPS